VFEIFQRSRQIGEEQFIIGGGAHRLKSFIAPGGTGRLALILQKSGGELPAFFEREFPRFLKDAF